MMRKAGGQTHMQSEKEHFSFTEFAWDKNKYTVMGGNLDRKRYFQILDCIHMG
jgi:hypothetical protein